MTKIATLLKAVIGTVLWMLVGIMVGSFLLDHGLPTVSKIEAPRTQSVVPAAPLKDDPGLAVGADQKVASEQKPPVPTKNGLLMPEPTDHHWPCPKSDIIDRVLINRMPERPIPPSPHVLTDRKLEQAIPADLAPDFCWGR